MKILPHQVASFCAAYFEGREEELRAIDSVAGMRKHALEIRDALEFAGFDNARTRVIAYACYCWSCKASPFVNSFDPAELPS